MVLPRIGVCLCLRSFLPRRFCLDFDVVHLSAWLVPNAFVRISVLWFRAPKVIFRFIMIGIWRCNLVGHGPVKPSYSFRDNGILSPWRKARISLTVHCADQWAIARHSGCVILGIAILSFVSLSYILLYSCCVYFTCPVSKHTYTLPPSPSLLLSP